MKATQEDSANTFAERQKFLLRQMSFCQMSFPRVKDIHREKIDYFRSEKIESLVQREAR
jgi:hypothetical protein